MARSAIVLLSPTNDAARAAADDVHALIERHCACTAVLDAHHDAPAPPEAKGVDIAVVLGGDGTLLGQTRRLFELDIAMLGVNFGKLGFMAEFGPESLADQAAEIFGGEGELPLRRLPMLDVRVTGADGAERFSGVALNDAVITAGPPYRMISVALSIDGATGPVIEGDGVIVSTPIGSTAYSVSAGGSIISPDVEALAVTPIAAHSLAFRPTIVGPESEVALAMGRVNEGAPGAVDGTTLVLDGQVFTPLRAEDRVTARTHPRRAAFVRNKRADYWSTLVTKLHWGAPTGGPSAS